MNMVFSIPGWKNFCHHAVCKPIRVVLVQEDQPVRYPHSVKKLASVRHFAVSLAINLNVSDRMDLMPSAKTNFCEFSILNPYAVYRHFIASRWYWKVHLIERDYLSYKERVDQ